MENRPKLDIENRPKPVEGEPVNGTNKFDKHRPISAESNYPKSLRVTLKPGTVPFVPLKEVTSRTCFLSVIQSVLAAEGHPLDLKELAEKVKQAWGRPFVNCPYSDEELLTRMINAHDYAEVHGFVWV